MNQYQPAARNYSDDVQRDSDEARDGSVYLSLEPFWIQAFSLKYWILGIIGLGLIFGLFATLLSTQMYRATAKIEISRDVPSVTSTESLDFGNRMSDLQYFGTQYELLESKFLAERVLESGNLARDTAFLEAAGLQDAGSVSSREIAERLLSEILIEPIKNSNLVNISYASSDSSVSAEIANLWAEEFLAANYDKRFGANIEARKFLEEQIKELRERLAISEKDLITYANANEIVILTQGSGQSASDTATQTLIGSELLALNDALAAAMTERIAAESAMRAGSVANSDGAAALRTRLAEAQSQLAELRVKFGPGYPEIKSKEAEVSSLRQALQSESNIGLSALQAAFRKAAMQERELRTKFQNVKSSFLGQQSQSIQYGILKREVETNRELYDALLQRYKGLESSGAGKNNMTLIEGADVPVAPYSPSLIFNLLIGLIAALLAAIVLVYTREVMDQSIRDPADVTRKLGLAQLGLIPRVESDDIVAELERRSSEISEAYAAARTNLAFLTPNGAPRSLMLTSSRPNEGKSISSVALARSFVQLGKKVLLIDADLRNSGLSDFIGIGGDPDKGLSSILSGNGSLDDAVVPVSPYGFDLLPTGHKPPNPVELLAQNGLGAVVQSALERYDHVLVDGAPVLGLADALEVSRSVEGVVYVIESNGVKIRAVQNALRRLAAANARIFGAVITKLDDRNSAFGYGYGYGYGYGNTDEDRTKA